MFFWRRFDSPSCLLGSGRPTGGSAAETSLLIGRDAGALSALGQSGGRILNEVSIVNLQ